MSNRERLEKMLRRGNWPVPEESIMRVWEKALDFDDPAFDDDDADPVDFWGAVAWYSCAASVEEEIANPEDCRRASNRANRIADYRGVNPAA